VTVTVVNNGNAHFLSHACFLQSCGFWDM